MISWSKHEGIMLLSATSNLENLNSTSVSRNPRVLARLSAMPSVPLLLGGRLLPRFCSCLVDIRLSVLVDLVYNIVHASWILSCHLLNIRSVRVH